MLRRSTEESDSSSPSTEFAQERRKPQSRVMTKKENSHPSGRLACDVCREQQTTEVETLGKVGCDRADPKCGRCTRLGYDCSYQGRKRHRAAQADLPRQLSELQDRLAQAEAMLQSSAASAASNTPATFPPQSELFWPQIPPPEPSGDHERLMQRLQNYATPMDRGFEGFDLLTNLTEDIPGFWGTIDPSLTSEILPLPQEDTPTLPTPLGSSYLLTGNSVSPNFNDTFFPSTPVLDELITPQDIAILKSRFQREWEQDPTSPRIRGLSFAVALIGTTICQRYAHLQSACYSNARKYAELCERDDGETYLMSLNAFQALLLIFRYELTKKHFARAWMTLGRAVTLAQILDLQHMDTVPFHQTNLTRHMSFPETGLPDIHDLASLEEMRRSFWTLYIFESYASIRIGRPCTLEEDKLRIFLPSPGELNEGFVPCSMPFLCEPAKLSGLKNLSSYAAVTIMVKLARLCYEHVGILSRGASDSGFWDRHYRLVKTINDYTAIFQGHLGAKAVREDPLAFSLHLNLCATHINLHEAAIRKVEEQELPKLVAAESRKCSTAAAFKILGAIRMNWPVHRSERDHFTLQATFIGWPISMSLNALSRNVINGIDTTPIGVVDSLRLLRAALDQIEEPDGYWHMASGAAVAALMKWDEQQSGSNGME
ncbi:unnamed protein product [Penicillium glandicola]